jgi:4-hydroxy-2-oxoheptanedioate aldolase
MSGELRALWDAGGVTVGAWCVIPSTFSAELLGRSGVDWVCIDTQHGLIGYDRMVPMLQALSGTGTPALVRVRWNEPAEIMKALDAGAQGVVVPMVNSPQEARAAAGACRYPPDGYRSWGPVRAALGVDGFSPATANQAVICAIMIETADGLARVDEILSVPGIDAVYVGPNDMAVTHGMPPDSDARDPRHRGLIRGVLEACIRHGVVPGIHCGSVETAAAWREEGFRMLNVNSDAVFLRQGAQAVAGALRAGAVASARPTGYA